MFYIEEGYDGENLQYFYVEKDLSALTALDGEQALKVLSESRLVLKSEKLGDDLFKFKTSEYPSAEVVDLR